MKKFMLIPLMIAMATLCWAAVIPVPTTASGVASVTINTDTLNKGVEDGFRGYTVRTEFITAGPLNLADQTINVKAVNTVFEVNCATNVGKAMRFSLEDDKGQLHEADRRWRTIEKPPASDTVAFIKTLVCK